MNVAVHQVDLGGAPEITRHVLALSAILAADGMSVTVHGASADVALPEGVVLCPCGERRSSAARIAHLRRRIPADATVHVHGGPGGDVPALAALAALRRSVRRVVYSPHGGVDGRDLTQRTSRGWRLSLADAVVCDSQEQTAAAGSLGAEAWLSPLVPRPPQAALNAWRREWGASDADRVVLFVGDDADGAAARLAQAAGAWPPERVLALAGPEPGRWRRLAEAAGAAGVRCRARVLQVSAADLLAALAAADVVVLPAGRAYAAPVHDLARQFGTPAVTLDAGSDVVAAVDDALATRAPHAAWAPEGLAIADLHRCAYIPPEAPAAEDPRRVSVLAWTASRGRTEELAAGLGGEGRTFYDLNITSRRLIPLRYVLSGVRTGAYLVRRRPRAVVISNPPIVLPVIGFAYARLARVPMLLDSQTKSFGQKGSRLGKAMLPVHRRISRGSTCTLVGAEELGDRVRAWGARAEVFHEAPPVWRVEPPSPVGDRPRVLWIGVLARDEPLDELLLAAASLPEVEFRVTGDLRRAPAGWELAPANVTWLGFVRGAAYPREIERADLVVTMTTDPASALRGAAEAVFARRPLLTSDWPFLRDLFPHAVYAANDADGIASGVVEALERLDELHAGSGDALDLHMARWAGQLERLRALIEPGHAIPATPAAAADRVDPIPAEQAA